MQIVGGTYLERVYEPYWYELFGSGMRAASSISLLSESSCLSTYLSPHDVPIAEWKSNTFGFHINSYERNQSISFTYFHGMSRPNISPNLIQIQHQRPIIINSDECTLRFGMVEGDAVVKGKVVVYDPQSAFHPTLFHDNGSISKNRLAIVLNASEALWLSQESSVRSAGKKLVSNHAVDVAVIKLGPLGCLVFDKDEVTAIYAYKTNQVFPIGSGDVFAAVFAHYWGEKGINSAEAADCASFAAAYYCNSLAVPLPRDFIKERVRFSPAVGTKDGKQVYLAGPFFTTAQRWLIEECFQALQGMKIQAFSPYHQVGMGSGEEIYSRDIEGLKKSHVVLACLDGLDAGTVYEIGYARAEGIPVVVFVQNESEENLKMIAGSGCRIYNDLVTALYQVVWTMMET